MNTIGGNIFFSSSDNLTKFVVLRELKTKRAEEVAYHVDIFCLLGSPHMLQSDNGREFANKIVKEVITSWPGCKLVHGKPRHSQSQGSVERANRDVEAILACWMKDNCSSHWAEGLRFVQWQKNNRLHTGIGRSPYQAMFGDKHKVVQSSNLPNEAWSTIETEEQLAHALQVKVAERDAQREIVNGGDSSIDQPSQTATAINTNTRTCHSESETFCSVCETVYEGSVKCTICQKCCHDFPPCSVTNTDSSNQVLFICQLCDRSELIVAERRGAKLNQVKQSESMLSFTAKRFKPADVGDNVLVPVPDVDRGRADFRNVKGIITKCGNDGTYKIGTSHGTLKQQYTRAQFIPTIGSFLEETQVPENEITLREVARNESLGSGQGNRSCTCLTGCSNNMCSCRQANRLCISNCHGSLSCKNKE